MAHCTAHQVHTYNYSTTLICKHKENQQLTQQTPAYLLQLLLHCPQAASQCNACAAQNQSVLLIGLWLLYSTKESQHGLRVISDDYVYSNCKGNTAHATIAAINLLPLLLQAWWRCMLELVHANRKPYAGSFLFAL
jgi:hypothetical protein